MSKKRIIFTLLYNNGMFSLSRNFRLQNVGNIDWIIRNYDFSNISFCIDELLVLNVSRNQIDYEKFIEDLTLLSEEIFVPIAVGGGIRSVEDARKLFLSGADKIVINSLIDDNPNIVCDISSEFGKQAIIVSIDTKKESQDDFSVWHNNGEKLSRFNLNELLHYLSEIPIGEIYLNSIDNDGTGNGYCVGLLNSIPKGIKTPIILAGGVGNYKHFIEGLDSKKIDAVATAHLFNFISDGLCNARLELIEHGFDLPIWDIEYKRKLKDCLVV